MSDEVHLSITVPPLSFSANIPHTDWAAMSDTDRVAWITATVAEQATPYAVVKATIAVPELPKVATPDIGQLQQNIPRKFL